MTDMVFQKDIHNIQRRYENVAGNLSEDENAPGRNIQKIRKPTVNKT
jgi:hypothetical protein